MSDEPMSQYSDEDINVYLQQGHAHDQQVAGVTIHKGEPDEEFVILPAVLRTGQDSYDLKVTEHQLLTIFGALVANHRSLRKEADRQRNHVLNKRESERVFERIHEELERGVPADKLTKAPWGMDDEMCLLEMRQSILEVLNAIATDQGELLGHDYQWMKGL